MPEVSIRVLVQLNELTVNVDSPFRRHNSRYGPMLNLRLATTALNVNQLRRINFHLIHNRYI